MLNCCQKENESEIKFLNKYEIQYNPIQEFEQFGNNQNWGQ